MAKTVEISFAIGAALTGNFNGVFGKAGQALSQLQNQTSNLQKASSQIQAFNKMQGSMAQTSEKLNAARMRVKDLAQQMRSTNTPTEALKRQFTAANVEANRLQMSLGNQLKKLGELRIELSGAGIDTRNLASEQARLTTQAQRVTDAQNRLAQSRAAFAATRQQLSWNNIKGELLTAAGAGMSLYAPTMKAADFEQAMARVNAVAFSGGGRDKTADAEAFKALQEQAKQLGRDTQFTAIQAAQSQENLARAGFNSNEIISAMPGLLNMAAAEGMDLANAADIAASTLRGFNMSADQSNRVADVLAQTSAASNTSIVGLGESMKYVAPIAAGLGVSVEQTAAMLGVMGNAGIKGSQAGTALRAAFSRLSKEPKAVAKALGALGIRAKDANGRLREMPELMQALSKRMKNMGEADQMQYLINIFGQEAGAGMLAVMKASVNGSLQQLEYLNKESNGIMTAILEHVNQGSTETVVSLEEMRAGMQDSESYARKLGISYKDLTISLAMLAHAGIKGEQVDKGLTAAFKQLGEQPAKVQKALKQFNISAYDKDGRLRELPVLLGEIKSAVMGMEQAKRLNVIESIFGKGSGATIQALMKTMTDDSLAKYNEVVSKAQGVSQEMAEKVTNTMRGAMTQASSAIEGLMITVGYVLLPSVTALVTKFKDFTSWVGTLAHENPKWTKAIVGTVSALAALKIGLVGAKIGWNLLKLPFQGVRVALDTLNAQALANAQNLTVAGKKAGLFSRSAKGISNAAKGIGRAFMSIGKGVGSFFKNMFSMGKNLVSGIFSPMGLKILAIAGIIAAVAAGAYLVYKNWDKIKAWWNSWTLKDVFAPVVEFAQRAKTYAIEKWNDFKTWWDSWTFSDIFAPIKEYAALTADYVLEKWENLKSWWNSWSLNDIFGDILPENFSLPEISWGSLKADFENAKIFIETGWENLKSVFTLENLAGIWDSLSSGFSAVCDAIKIAWEGVTGFIKDAWDKASEYVSGAWKWTKELFGFDTEGEELEAQLKDITALNRMSEGFSKRVSEMTEAWQPFKKSLGEGFEQIYTTMQGVADKIRGVTIPAVNELTIALSKVATEIRSIVEAGNLSMKVETQQSRGFNAMPEQYKRMAGFQAHAAGGIFSTPHLGIVAEAGREAVIPLQDKNRGIPLLMTAAKELGVFSKIPNLASILDIATPLEDKVKGIPLWKAAEPERNILAPQNTTNTTNNNSENNSRSVTLSPSFNITVNGGERGIEQRFKQIVEEVLGNLRNDMERLSFA